MQIQVNTDNSIDGREKLIADVKDAVEGAIGRFSNQITRVEVHLSDENSIKGGQHDQRCMMEARMEGLRPTAVTETAPTIEQAVAGAAGKLKRSLESTVGRLSDRR